VIGVRRGLKARKLSQPSKFPPLGGENHEIHRWAQDPIDG
jgi:hypothetical protein